MLSGKIKSCDKISLINGKKIVTWDNKNAEIWNSFFSSAVKNLRIPEFQEVIHFSPVKSNIGITIALLQLGIQIRDHIFIFLMSA